MAERQTSERDADRLGRGVGRAARAALFATALAVGLAVARPLQAASIATDSQACVLYFLRIVNGQRLEMFVPTTPKPLLTLVFGVLETVTGEWRTVAWATLLAFGVAVVLTAELVRRSAGWAGWAFVGAGLAGSTALILDVGFALATPWALLLVSAAGLALTSERPRHALAGSLLMLAVLARLEVVLVLGAVSVILMWRRLGPDRWVGSGRPAGRAWLTMIGWLALPIMAVHDWLLTGDPWYWTTVATRYSVISGYVILDPPGMLAWLANHLAAEWPLAILGVAGVLGLVLARRWVLAAGITALGPGMAVLLLLLAAEHVYVPDRYAAPIDIALIAAAGWLVGRVATDFPGVSSAAVPRALTAVAALAIGVGLVWPGGVLAPTLASRIQDSLATAADFDRVEPTLRTYAESPGTVFRVTNAIRERLAIDLGIPLTRVLDLYRNPVTPGDWQSAVGQVVFHDRHVDGSLPGLEGTTVRALGGALAVPIQVDARAGYWVIAIQAR